MNVQLLVSINGGAYASGVQTAAFGQTMAPKAASTAPLNAIRYEIYEYPIGFACPAGWSTDLTQGGTGVYFYAPVSVTTPPPVVTLPASGPNNWGPFMLRLRGNTNPNRLNDDGTPNQQYDPSLTDESSFVLILSPTLGMTGVARGMTNQLDGLRLWAGVIQGCLRLLDNASSGGSFSAGGDLGGSAISQNVLKVHGASVPIAGALVTGNGLYVSGTSALTYSALNLAGGAGWVSGILPVANGGTGLGTVGSNGQVLTVVGGVPAWAAPSGSAFSAGGDLGGTATSQSVLAVHGASVPIAGALVTGNVLQVTGVSTLGYGPVNLAGGAGSIVGSLPAGNQAAQTMGGDVTGTTAAAVVAKVNGATVPIGGALTIGNVLQVSGAGALSYGAINLASPSAVGGSLGVANGGTGLSALGAADQLLGMNHAGLALAYFTAIGDATLVSGSFTVVALQGFGIATSTPTSGQVLTWNSGTSKWTATTPGSAAAVTGSGIWHSTAGSIDGAAYLGTAGQALFTNAGATDTAWTTFSKDVSAAAGTPGQITVVGLQGHAVLSTAPTAGQFFVEAAGASGWSPVSLSGDVTASITSVGDLTVVALQGFGVATSTPTSGQVLTWNSGSSKWTATTPSGGVSVTGSGILHATAGTLDGAANKGTAGQALFTNSSSADTAWAAFSLDIAGSTSTPGALTVVGIRGNPVSITAATAGQFLVENAAATGSAWTSLSGDVSASTGTPADLTVVALQGFGVATSTPTAGQVLTWISGTSKWTATTPGSAASVTGSGVWHSTAGSLDSGAYKGTAGQGLFTGAGATDTGWASFSADVTASTTTPGAITVVAIQGHGVTTSAPTAGQFLIENSSSTSWGPVSISGDISASTSTVGLLTVVALQGFGVATTTPTSGQALVWNASSSKWTPTTISAGASVTGSGIWHSTAGTLDGAASKGTAGQSLFTNAGSTDTAWASFSGDVTGSTGTPGAITVVALQGHGVLSGAPTAGQFLVEAAGAAGWGPVSLSGDVSASTATAGLLTVVGLQGFGVATTTPTAGQVLTWISGTSKWTPTTLSASASVTGSGVWHSTTGALDSAASKGSAGQSLFTNAGATDTAWASFSADVTASTGTPGALTVVALQGHAVASTAPTAGQFFVENAGASSWGPVSISGDVSASVVTVGLLTVVALQGFGVATTTPTSGQVLAWNAGTSKWTPTAPAAGASVTGSGVWHSTGGTLDGAASKGTAGQALFTNAGSSDTAWATFTGDASASTSTPGAITVKGLQGNPISATPATAGQFLVEAAGAAGSAWSTISADVTASTTTAGALTVVAIQGTPVSATPPTAGQGFIYNGTTYVPTLLRPAPERFQVLLTSASGTVTIPASYRVFRVSVTVDTPYSAGAQLAIGQTGSAALIAAAGQIDIVGASAGQVFDVPADVAWGSALTVLATLTGAPSVGQLHVLVDYGPVST